MVRYFLIAAVAAFLLAGPVKAFAAGDQEAGDGIIGTVMEVEGKATVTPAGQKTAKPLAVKDPLHMKDVISTSAITQSAPALDIGLDITEMPNVPKGGGRYPAAE